MASILEGYNYDIFVSYRQKDNKHSRWVTEFVNNLKNELEATFKEEITVYFDENPYDGLLETHNVTESLADKLKCLIFIPVISRTYCDPASFAWEHELKGFLEEASKDRFGLNIRLPNGNVASRILPVIIYNIDRDDRKLYESLLGDVLRGIDFIYSEPGVNRPLKPGDNDKNNLNKTKYENQINKIGNAIKDLISGLKTGSAESGLSSVDDTEIEKKIYFDIKPEKLRRTGTLQKHNKLYIIIAALIIFGAILIKNSDIFSHTTLDQLRGTGKRIVVAVMPFQNITGDTSLNILQLGIQYNIINSLSNYPENLQVRQSTSISDLLQDNNLAYRATLAPSVVSKISRKLDANIVITGNYSRYGPELRLTANLINPVNMDILKSITITGQYQDMVLLADSLSLRVKNELIISSMENGLAPEFSEGDNFNSPESFRYFILGQNAFNVRNWKAAAKYYSKAIAIDSNIYSAYTMLTLAYINMNSYREAKKISRLNYSRKNKSWFQEISSNYTYSFCFETPYEQIKYIKQMLKTDDQLPRDHFILGMAYLSLNQYDKAIPEYEKSLDIYQKWGIKPTWAGIYFQLAIAYAATGDIKKFDRLVRKAEKEFAGNPIVISLEAARAIMNGNEKQELEYIDNLKAAFKEQSTPEYIISDNIALIYSWTNKLDKAEKYYRQAFELSPDSVDAVNKLAFFLIDKDINIEEGIAIVDNGLKSDPDNFEYLHTKGWGLYKQKKYEEAYKILQKSWDLRMKNGIYEYNPYLHLEAAKKSLIESQRNT